MSVALVYPFRRNVDIGAGPPIGLLYLATYLKKRGFESFVIDLGGEESSDDEVIDGLLRRRPAIVGFPLYSVNMKKVYDFSVRLRDKGYSGAIVIGAQHATALPEEAMGDFRHVDYLIRYEAEIPLAKLAAYVIEGKGRLDDIENLYYREGGIKHTAQTPDINRDLDGLPFPDRSFLERYYRKGIYNRPYTRASCDFMICARGCPFRCNFCFPSNSAFRTRSTENIISELRYLKGLGRRHVEILDDTFTANKKELEKTLTAIAGAKLNISFKIRSRANVIDERLMALMKAAGVRMIVYGVESGSDRMLKAMNKAVTAAENARAIEITKKAGIACFADIFVGYPGEDAESIEETVGFLLKTRPLGINIGAYYPLPLTVGFERAKAEGTLKGNWSFRHTRHPYVKLDWVENLHDLQKAVRMIRKRFYLHPAVFRGTAAFVLRNVGIGDLPRILSISKRMMFAKSN